MRSNLLRQPRKAAAHQPAPARYPVAARRSFPRAARHAFGRFAQTTLLLAGIAVVAPAVGRAQVAVPLPAEQTPYEVSIIVTFGQGSVPQQERRREMIARLAEAVERSVGPMWNCRVSEQTDGSPAAVDALERTSVGDVQQEFTAAGIDKAYLLAIGGDAAGYRLAAREWDSATRDLSRPVSRRMIDLNEFPQLALTLVHALFRPVIIIDRTRWGALVCRARAGELAAETGDWQPFAAGRMFEPYFRYLSMERTVERVQRVPWTWLLPVEPRRATADCEVISGLRSPLSGHRRRVEVVALGIRPQAESTLLRVRTFPPAQKPLAGIEIEIVAGEDAEPLRFVSDRSGTVRLPGTVTSEAPYVWLNARSGQAWLARIPFVPGLHDTELLELPDDAPRLRAEGEIALLQADLVDTVARRAVLAATARARAKERRFKEMDEAISEVRALPRAEKFTAELNTIRVRFVREAREAKDRNAEGRIVRLCEETADLIKFYLDDDKIRAVREELEELRRIAAEDEAARKQFEAQESRRKK
jgi:hypothetical protein